MPKQCVTLSGSALQGFGAGLVPQSLLAQLPLDVCLGRNRPRARPQCLPLRKYMKAQYRVPTLPIDYATAAKIAIAHMFLNDTYGCCVISDRYHSVGVWTANSQGTPIIGTDQEVLNTYRIWNPGNQDNGCVITDVLDYARDRGIQVAGQTHKIAGYVSVDWTNWDETLVALYLTGANPIGINLPEAWTQNSIWDVTNTQIVGGHDVPNVGAEQDGIIISSWGRLYKITKAAWTSRNWLEEHYCVLAPDWFNPNGLAPNMLDVATLQADLQDLAQNNIPPIDPTLQPWENILP